MSSESSRSPSPNYVEDKRLPDNTSISPAPITIPPAEDFPGFYDRNYRLATESWINSFTQGGSKKNHPPLDVLCRLFPHKKRTDLDHILRGCGGDTVQAIEQILAAQTQEEKNTNGLVYPATPHTALTNPLQNSVLKSAFSPIPSLSAANTLSTMRYAWGGAASRGLAMAMPYSHFLPGFSMGSTFGYNPLTTQTDKLAPYSMYPFWTGKPFVSKDVEKTSGCVSD